MITIKMIELVTRTKKIKIKIKSNYHLHCVHLTKALQVHVMSQYSTYTKIKQNTE